jgi:pimeloyl-ACP methyl ester carboxylesterase
MQRRAFLVQAGASQAPEAPDPVEQNPGGLATIDVPALVAAGEREPFSDFGDGARALAQTLPGGRHAVIEGAGHLAPLESPMTFRGLLLDFLGGD